MTTLAEYLEWPGEHFTTLREMLVSPRAYLDACAGRPDTDTLRRGRAGHSAILEPNRYELDYAIWDARTESGRKAPRNGGRWEAFEAAHAHQTVITEEQHVAALAMRDAVRSHPVAAELLGDARARTEVAVQWSSADIACKGRIDLVTPAVVGELKCVADPGEAFARAAWRRHYFMQLAMYVAGAASASAADGPTWTTRTPVIIAVQNKRPWDVVVYDVPPAELAMGREQFDLALEKLIICRAANEWPGQAPTARRELKAPSWVLEGGDPNGDPDWMVSVSEERTDARP